MHINAIASYVTCPLKILSDNILLIYIINSRKLANLNPKIPIAWDMSAHENYVFILNMFSIGTRRTWMDLILYS